MAFVDDPNSQSDQQVAGATPLSTGQDSSAPMAEGSQNTAPTGSTIQSQPSESPSGPQSSTINKKAPKASSGMFTNIQKYVDKNKPQAQRIAGAVTQDVGKQAEQIRQAAQEKQQQQQQTLQANQNLIQQNQDWAQQQVQGIMGGETTPQQPSQEDISKFQNLMQGNVQGIQQVGDLNLAQQQNRASALARLAEGAGTEQGRRNLLGETFRKQGDYTQGMSGLDQLITSGDKTARESLVTGIGEQAQGLQSQLGDISTQARQGLASQQQALKGLGGEITSLGTEAASGIKSDIQSKVDQEQATRQAIMEGFDPTQTDFYNRVQELKAIYNPELSGLKLSRLLNAGAGSLWGRNWDDFISDSSRFSSYDDLVNKAQFSQKEQNMLGLGPEEMRYFNDATLYELNPLGSRIANKLANYNLESDLATQLEKAGATRGSFNENRDLTLANLASEDQISRYNALKSLLGQSDIITPESKQDYVSSEELQSILDRYKL